MKKLNTKLARAAAALLLAMLIPVGMWADSGKIIVWLNNGSTVPVLFGDMPEFTYTDGYVTLQSSNPSTALSWPIESLQKLTFENIATDIKDVKATGLDIVSENATAYDIEDRIVKTGLKSLSELPKGVFIIKDGNVTTKVVRK